MERPLYIFDLDGTLADNKHREHFLGNKDDPDRWRRFFEACGKDEPIQPVISTMTWLLMNAEVWVWSGRSAEVREVTEAWLGCYTALMSWEVRRVLRMRNEGDYTPDDELKRSWLREMSAADRSRLVAVFDDRQEVVDMWRSEGVPCFQVAPGDF